MDMGVIWYLGFDLLGGVVYARLNKDLALPIPRSRLWEVWILNACIINSAPVA